MIEVPAKPGVIKNNTANNNVHALMKDWQLEFERVVGHWRKDGDSVARQILSPENSNRDNYKDSTAQFADKVKGLQMHL